MTIRQALKFGTTELTKAHTHDPEGCAKFLLRHAMGKPMGITDTEFHRLVISNDTFKLSPECATLYKQTLERRMLHEPVWYITQEAFFWKDPLYVDGRVLVPRPETELLVEEVLKFVDHSPKRTYRVVDVGTGAGGIAIALYKELKVRKALDKLVASDISVEAIEVAKKNARATGADGIEFLIGDSLEPFTRDVDIIAGNPPYVPTETVGGLSYDIHHFEPRVALDGGIEGLDIHQKILAKAPTLLKKGGSIFLEIGHDQGEKSMRMASKYFKTAKIRIVNDYQGHDRILEIRT